MYIGSIYVKVHIHISTYTYTYPYTYTYLGKILKEQIIQLTSHAPGSSCILGDSRRKPEQTSEKGSTKVYKNQKIKEVECRGKRDKAK